MISIPVPTWQSEVANTIVALEKLRNLTLRGKIPPHIFFELKNTFQLFETLGSARIEGNNTTLSDLVEHIIDRPVENDEKLNEIANLDHAISKIEEDISENSYISADYLHGLHRDIMRQLSSPKQGGEGSLYPGQLRPIDVTIQKSAHRPPNASVLSIHFQEFIDFINGDYDEKDQLLMVATAHHRFMHIHPYDNGNGRMGRLLDYALLIKLGFNVKFGRIINPSAIFYTDRGQYYNMLSQADSLEDSDLLHWVSYFLDGLKNQIEHIDRLLELEFTRDKILLPSVGHAFDRGLINREEYRVLHLTINSRHMSIKAADLEALGIEKTYQRTYLINKLLKSRMLQPLPNKKREYTIKFAHSYLLRGVVKALQEHGFIPDFLEG